MKEYAKANTIDRVLAIGVLWLPPWAIQPQIVTRVEVLG
jgi:hypothetical protein